MALMISIFVWIFAITKDSYSSSSMSGLQAFGYIIYSVSALVSSFALQGFTYIVKAAIRYLDEKGEFDV